MAQDYNKIAKDIFDEVQKYGIVSADICMTRLRIKLKATKVDLPKLKKIPGVLGVIVTGDEFQFVVGPGVVKKVYASFKPLLDSDVAVSSKVAANCAPSLKEVADQVKSENKSKRQSNLVAIALSKFAKIFTPLIPTFIAAGILAGVAGILQSIYTTVDITGSRIWTNTTASEWYWVFQLLISAWSTGFLIIVGYRFSEAFGGTGWIGALIGAIYTPLAGTAFASMYNATAQTFLGIHVVQNHLDTFWLTSGLVTLGNDGNPTGVGTPHGSIFGIILGCTVAIYLEKYITKVMPVQLDTVVTPFLVALFMVFINIFLIIPVSGYLFFGMTWLFSKLCRGPGAPFGDMVLASVFLIAVMFGIHQGFLPVYVAMIQDPNIGINILFPVLALAGASQVGCALAMWVIAKKGGTFRKQIQGAIIPGFLGIGEPLIYGVSLPRIIPFISACVGAAVPGFFVGAINAWGGIDMGLNSISGPSGILAIFMITSAKGMGIGIAVYTSALLIGYASGFATGLLGYRLFKNNPKINWNLE